MRPEPAGVKDADYHDGRLRTFFNRRLPARTPGPADGEATVDLNAFSMILIGCALALGVVLLVFALRRAFGRATGEIGGWEMRGSRRMITAVARATLAEGVRTRLVILLILLLGAWVVGVYFFAEGDGTIKGRVQMFLSYSLGMTGFLLAMLTILFACRSLSHEIASRQIFGLVSKPIPRWQIVVGKWLGVMSLNVLLLGGVGLATYAGTRRIVSNFRAALEHELVSHGGLDPEQAAAAVAALDRVRGIGREGTESPILDAMMSATGMSRQGITDVLLKLPEATRVNLRSADELRRQVLVARAGLSPEIPREELDRLVEEEIKRRTAEGELPEKMREGALRGQLQTELYNRYRSVAPGESRSWTMHGPRPRRSDDFLMSIRFKIQVPADVGALEHPQTGEVLERDTLLCIWAVGDPKSSSFAEQFGPVPIRIFKELEIPTYCIRDDGTIILTFVNVDPRDVDAVFDFPAGLSVLYSVGSFEMNVLRACAAMLVPLVCLASLGICASTFLSFPVGSLILVWLYLISLCMGFIAESMGVTEEYAPPDRGLEWELRRLVVESFDVVLSVGDLQPTRQLIEGRRVEFVLPEWDDQPWNKALGTWPFALAKSAIMLMIGVLVFRRRELAAVIV